MHDERAYLVHQSLVAVLADSLSASYSGDNNYNAAIATASVVVSAPVNASFTINGGSLTVQRGLSASNTSTVTTFPTWDSSEPLL